MPPKSKNLVDRVGAKRRTEIPPEVRDGLNAGRLATVNLVEFLAIDASTLVRRVFADLDERELGEHLGKVADDLASAGVMERVSKLGTALASVLRASKKRKTLASALARHSSDMVRNWMTYACVALAKPTLADQLQAVRPYAADAHFGVRECAWLSVRNSLLTDVRKGISILQTWVEDADANVRRFAIELTRPRGVWCSHSLELKQHPQLGEPLLEPARADPSRYVQTSVANWINDASKSAPDWALSLCARWEIESPTRETAWIVRRAKRSL